MSTAHSSATPLTFRPRKRPTRQSDEAHTRCIASFELKPVAQRFLFERPVSTVVLYAAVGSYRCTSRGGGARRRSRVRCRSIPPSCSRLCRARPSERLWTQDAKGVAAHRDETGSAAPMGSSSRRRTAGRAWRGPRGSRACPAAAWCSPAPAPPAPRRSGSPSPRRQPRRSSCPASGRTSSRACPNKRGAGLRTQHSEMMRPQAVALTRQALLARPTDASAARSAG